jgi:hypothetical protein
MDIHIPMVQLPLCSIVPAVVCRVNLRFSYYHPEQSKYVISEKELKENSKQALYSSVELHLFVEVRLELLGILHNFKDFEQPH